MDKKEILKFCLENGLLLDRDILELFSKEADFESAKILIEKLRDHTGKNIITKNIFVENREKIDKFFISSRLYHT